MPIFKVQYGHNLSRPKIAVKADSYEEFTRKAKFLLKIPDQEDISITLEDGTLLCEWDTLSEYGECTIMVYTGKESDQGNVIKVAQNPNASFSCRDDILKRIEEIRYKRLNPDLSGDKPPSKKKLKPTLKLTCGIKILQNGLYRSVKAKSGIRLTFERGLKYRELCEKLKEEFKVQENDECFLIGHDNQRLNEEDFTVGNYYNDWKVVGYCRIYLCILSRASVADHEDGEKILDKHEASDKKVVSKGTNQEAADTNREPHAPATDEASDKKVVSKGTNQEAADTNREPHAPATDEASDKKVVSTCTPTKVLTTPKAGTSTQEQTVSNPDAIYYNFDEDMVEPYLIEMIEEENVTMLKDPMDSSSGDLLLVDTKQFTPVYLRNPATTYYKDYINSKSEKKMATAHSGYGEFLLIPNEEFDTYLSMAHALPVHNMFTVNPLTMKFAIEFSNYEIVSLSENVWLFPENAANHFREWFDENKEKVKNSM